MDPSFDDLLESLDAIQAERSSTQQDNYDYDDNEKHHHHHHHHDDHHDHHDHHDHGHQEHVHEEFHLPQVRASVQLDFSPPPPPASHHESPYQASRDHAPIESFSAPIHHTNHANPSRSGDITQYQRQSVIQPIQPPRQQHHGGGGGGGGGGDSRCAKCNNSLYGTEFVTAAGKNYHQEHFTCGKCNKKLIGAYYDHHNQVYCPNCAGELMPCDRCHRGITGQYMILDGRPYHNECVERKHCAHCHGPIEDTVLTALGKTWHSRCFKCIQCGKELGREFIAKDGHGQCVNCSDRARPACERCRNPLSGEYINFQGQSYHQDCFVCAQCRSRLGTSGFFNVGGQLKCQRCAK